MKKFLLSATLALASCFAFATSMVAQQGNDYVIVRDVPCNPAVLAAGAARGIEFPAGEEPHGGAANISGTSYQLCWTVRSDGNGVNIMYDDGDTGVIPLSAFAKNKDT